MPKKYYDQIELLCHAFILNHFSEFLHESQRGPNFKWENFPEMMEGLLTAYCYISIVAPKKYHQEIEEYTSKRALEISQKAVNNMMGIYD